MTCLAVSWLAQTWAKYKVQGDMPLGGLFAVAIVADLIIAAFISGVIS